MLICPTACLGRSNRIHASDVLQTMHVLLRRGGLVPGVSTK